MLPRLRSEAETFFGWILPSLLKDTGKGAQEANKSASGAAKGMILRNFIMFGVYQLTDFCRVIVDRLEAMLYKHIMQRVAVLNVVGLTTNLIGDNTPRIKAFIEENELVSFIPEFPAVTCTAQASYVTGEGPSGHGIVGNGWYDRDYAEVGFWKQSNHLVQGEKIWHRLRNDVPGFTVAKMFWWYNMYADVDFSCTPRPIYPADGRKFFDVHTQPMAMREEMKADLGDFPFPSFWGPRAGIASSQWIAESAKWVESKEQPSLNLVYLPHLDYCLQQYGPSGAEVVPELHAIDEVVGDLIDFFQSQGVVVSLLSEYGISKVDKTVHLNREFRKRGWLEIKDELGLDRLECGQSKVFAVADHQVAHIYINDKSLTNEVRTLIEGLNGVEEVREGNWTGVGAERGGDMVAVADSNAWFTYYYWEDDSKAPDFARCIDIHRKPGYDPAELFVDPEITFPMLKIAGFLLKKKLGIRGLLDVIPLDASLVKGSHGRDNVEAGEQPIWVAPKGGMSVTKATDVAAAIEQLVKGGAA